MWRLSTVIFPNRDVSHGGVADATLSLTLFLVPRFFVSISAPAPATALPLLPSNLLVILVPRMLTVLLSSSLSSG